MPDHLQPRPNHSVIDDQLARDRGLLEMLTLQCDECKRYGAAHDGKWRLISGLTYCEACAEAES